MGARQKAFWEACLNYEPEYDRQLLLKFFCYWAEEVNGTGLMLWETKTSWSMTTPGLPYSCSRPSRS